MQIKAFTKGKTIDEQAEALGQQLGALKYDALVSMAEVISQTSPVDSGNYARNHEVALRSASFRGDQVRPDSDSRISRDGVPQYEDAQSDGLSNMIEDIEGFGLLNTRILADPQQSNFVFRNRMEYANYVEQEHAVYARARREVTSLIAESVAKVRR